MFSPVLRPSSGMSMKKCYNVRYNKIKGARGERIGILTEEMMKCQAFRDK